MTPKLALPLSLLIAVLAIASWNVAGGSTKSVSNVAGAEGLLERLEWRSVISIGQESEFGIFDPVSESSFWVGPRVSRHGIEVVEYDREANFLHLRIGETTHKFGLAQAGTAVSGPRVNLVPSPEEDSSADQIVPVDEEIPTVTMIPPSEGDPMAAVGLAGMDDAKDAPVMEVVPASEDDEMTKGAR